LKSKHLRRLSNRATELAKARVVTAIAAVKIHSKARIVRRSISYTQIAKMDFNQQRQMEEEYYRQFKSLHQGIAFFKALQQDSQETRLKINTLLYRPNDAPSTWTDLFRLPVFPDFPEQLDLFECGESIVHVENPDTFQVGHHNNKRLLFLDK
jgi:hypothetical protein